MLPVSPKTLEQSLTKQVKLYEINERLDFLKIRLKKLQKSNEEEDLIDRASRKIEFNEKKQQLAKMKDKQESAISKIATLRSLFRTSKEAFCVTNELSEKRMEPSLLYVLRFLSSVYNEAPKEGAIVETPTPSQELNARIEGSVPDYLLSSSLVDLNTKYLLKIRLVFEGNLENQYVHSWTDLTGAGGDVWAGFLFQRGASLDSRDDITLDSLACWMESIAIKARSPIPYFLKPGSLAIQNPAIGSSFLSFDLISLENSVVELAVGPEESNFDIFKCLFFERLNSRNFLEGPKNILRPKATSNDFLAATTLKDFIEAIPLSVGIFISFERPLD